MISYLTEVGAGHVWKRDLQLWIPLSLIAVLLLPMAFLLLPLLLIGCLSMGVRFYRMLRFSLELLLSLRGTQLEIAMQGFSFVVHMS